MANTTTITPTAQIRGYENEEATDHMTTGLGVKAGTDPDKIQIASTDEAIEGVVALDQDQVLYDPVAVHMPDGGSCYVRSGAAFVRDAWLTTDSVGRFVTAGAGKKQAKALAKAVAADELVPALLVTSIAGAAGATGATGPTGPTGATGPTGP